MTRSTDRHEIKHRKNYFICFRYVSLHVVLVDLALLMQQRLCVCVCVCVCVRMHTRMHACMYVKRQGRAFQGASASVHK